MMIFLRVGSKDFSHSLDDIWTVKQTDSNKCGDLLFHLKSNILCKYPFADRSMLLSQPHSVPLHQSIPSRARTFPSCIIMFLSGRHKGIIKEEPSHRYLISNSEMVRLYFVVLGRIHLFARVCTLIHHQHIYIKSNKPTNISKD